MPFWGFFTLSSSIFCPCGTKVGVFVRISASSFVTVDSELNFLQITKLEANKVRFWPKPVSLGRAWGTCGGHGPLRKGLKRVHTCCTYTYWSITRRQAPRMSLERVVLKIWLIRFGWYDHFDFLYRSLYWL